MTFEVSSLSPKFRCMEAVEVQFTAAGQPLRVLRKGRVWTAVAEPVRWYERIPWWRTELRATKGSLRIDSLVWQVQVALGARTSEPVTWELVHHPPTGGWRVREPGQRAS